MILWSESGGGDNYGRYYIKMDIIKTSEMNKSAT